MNDNKTEKLNDITDSILDKITSTTKRQLLKFTTLAIILIIVIFNIGFIIKWVFYMVITVVLSIIIYVLYDTYITEDNESNKSNKSNV